MRVILKENIENLGKKGDIVDVAPGYGRNFLIPKNFALEVTAKNLKMIEIQQQALKKGLDKEMASHRALIDQLNAVTLHFPRKAGEKDAIFGSVSSADIKEALERLNFDVEKKKILLDEPIKKLGNYTISIKVIHDEKAEIKIEVVKLEEAEKREKKRKEKEEEAQASQPEEKVPSEEKAKDETPLESSENKKEEAAENAVPAEEESVPPEEDKTVPAADKPEKST
jgi:large subunit ribosomal protein L9